MYLLLPLPEKFKSFLKYDLDDQLPVWMEGIFKSPENRRFYNLFDREMELKDLDKVSQDAINEFAFNSINMKKLIEEYSVPKNLDFAFKDFPLRDVVRNNLLRHGIQKYSDMKILDGKFAKQLKMYEGFGLKKVFEAVFSIESLLDENAVGQAMSEFNDGASTAETSQEAEIFLSDQELDKELNKFQRVPFEKFNFKDSRLLSKNYEVTQYVRNDLDDDLNWLEVIKLARNFVPAEKLKIIIQEISDIYSDICNLNLEGQIEDYCQAINSRSFVKEKYFLKILDRLGLRESKKKTPTLEELGKKVGVTRERIRQVEAKFIRRKNYISTSELIYIPLLDKVYDLLKNCQPMDVGLLEKKIAEEGFGNWSLVRIIKCLLFFNYPHEFEIIENVLTKKGESYEIPKVKRVAKRIVSYNGVVEIEHLKNTLKNNYDIQISPSDLKKILSPRFKEITEGWFYTETKENGLRNIAYRISNFVKTISIQDIKDGQLKYENWRSAGFESSSNKSSFYGFLIPDINTIKKLFNLFEDFEVKENSVTCLGEQGSKYLEHSDVDISFYEFFKARNFQVCNHQELKEYFMNEGMKESSFHSYLSYKPYLKNYSRGIWGVVGYPPSNEEVENSKSRIEKNPKAKIEWAENGVLEIKCFLTNVSGFVFGISPDFERYIAQDEFSLNYADKEYCKIKKSGVFWYGASKYLQNVLHCNIGDYIKISLDLNSYRAEIAKISSTSFHD